MSMSAVRVYPVRYAHQWVEDMTWHRHMFDQSYFQWGPHDALEVALKATHGRLVHESPKHLQVLDRQLSDLVELTGQIEDAMACYLEEAQTQGPEVDWDMGLQLLGMSQRDVDEIQWRVSHCPAVHNVEADKALRGWPLPNPLSQVWELRQVHSLWSAAVDIVDDTVCDLVTELAPKHGWGNLAYLTVRGNEDFLRQRVQWQRDHRGDPADPRRRCGQVWDGSAGRVSTFI